jgi:hypothetical protein
VRPAFRAGNALVFCGCVIAGGGCANLAKSPSTGPTPSPGSSASPGASPTPTSTASGLCSNQTRDPNASIIVSIDPDFAAAPTAYGTVFGYAVYDPTGTASIPVAAQAIAATTSTTIQFANYDPGTIPHTATGFPGVTAFPAEPFAFSSTSLTPVGTSISGTAWSTGALQSFGNQSSVVCYSQTFTLPTAGTYYFGDDPLYNSPSSFRGVVVVSSSS